MKTTTLALTLVFLAAGGVSAAENVYDPASWAEPLETLGYSARAAALGSALCGEFGGLDNLELNPASVAELPSPELALHENEWLAGIRREELALGYPFFRGGASLSLQMLQYGSMDRRDDSGTVTGSLSPSRFGLTATAGRKIYGPLALGASFHEVHQSMDSASYDAWTADVGALCRLPGRFQAGAALCQWGLKQKGFSPDQTIRVGVSRRFAFNPDQDLLVAASTSVEVHGYRYAQMGLEIPVIQAFALRGGYQAQLGGDNAAEGGQWTTGFGLAIRHLTLDYAFAPMQSLGLTHRISLKLVFGTGRKKPVPYAIQPHGGNVSNNGSANVNNGPIQTRPVSSGLPSNLLPTPPTTAVSNGGINTGSIFGAPQGNAAVNPGANLINPAGPAGSQTGISGVPTNVGSTQTQPSSALTGSTSNQSLTGANPNRVNIPAPGSLSPAVALPGTSGASNGSAGAVSVSGKASPEEKNNLRLVFSLPKETPVASPAPQTDLDRQISALQTILQTHSKDVKTWYQLGGLYYGGRRKEEAIQCFEQVLRLRPDLQSLRVWLKKYEALSP